MPTSNADCHQGTRNLENRRPCTYGKEQKVVKSEMVRLVKVTLYCLQDRFE